MYFSIFFFTTWVTLLPSICALAHSDWDSFFSKRVFGGLEVTHPRPFFLSLRSTFCRVFHHENGTCIGEEIEWCGATVISRREFITARHCLEHLGLKLLSVLVDFGPFVRGQPSSNTRIILDKRKNFIAHQFHDLAIGIFGDMKLPATSNPMELCPPFIRTGSLAIDGRGNRENPALPLPYLREIEVHLVEVPFDVLQDGESLIFTRSKSELDGVCRGDSGGPLLTIPEGMQYLCLLGVLVADVQEPRQKQISVSLQRREIRDFVNGKRYEHNAKLLDTVSPV